MTTHALAEFTDRDQATVKKTINDSRQRYGSAVFRVASWDLHRGTPGPPSPRFVPGPGTDAPRPETDNLATWRRYDRRNRVKRAIYRRVQRGVHQARPFDMLLLVNRQKSFS